MGKLNRVITGEDVMKDSPKEWRDYRQEALKKDLSHFSENDWGKLFMIYGTVKTLTSLSIVEMIAQKT
ncbi:MAG: hypothetical protein OXC03_02785 [Flavobacteriaceae bacterium]|nr:hypothetical protein [Flavobacteriaceae bacterium]